MAIRPADLSPGALEFMGERHLATLTTFRADGSPHVVPVGFTWDARVHDPDRGVVLRHLESHP